MIFYKVLTILALTLIFIIQYNIADPIGGELTKNGLNNKDGVFNYFYVMQFETVEDLQRVKDTLIRDQSKVIEVKDIPNSFRKDSVKVKQNEDDLQINSKGFNENQVKIDLYLRRYYDQLKTKQYFYLDSKYSVIVVFFFIAITF
ncbi:uncharacterized protein LOC132923116 isoform X1 [Rhopalosiphum padi]|uniref:uncharacterized protein LOC132923116 isoform X1 n=1 Tax=Rhopalosiphum padi TaxID=40932 RepID=UPI00298EB604|nr:uncharacterized protein LOC132923116 isoform X1 [Rhopalosiphum padi]